MQPKIFQFEIGPMQNLCYLVSDENNSAVLIDPGFDAEKIISAIQENKIKVKYILLTHSHFDHIRAIPELKKSLNIPILCHPNENPSISFNSIYQDEIIEVGNLKIKVIETPGHSRGSVCFLIGDNLFSGDTLFYHSFGRTDLPEGNENEMLNSLKKLFELPKETQVYPGHDYGAKTTTIGEEKEFFEKNIF
jgi:hydroxyacylglutathione hydrolase